MTQARDIMDADSVKRAINRMAQEIIEYNGGAEHLVIVGLYKNGVFLARRLADAIARTEHCPVPVGSMDITLYRDDIGLRADGPHLPDIQGTQISFDITDKIVILVDDVLNTGRSIRAALDQLMDLGRPRKIQLVGLVDRGGRELPIRPDFLGREISAAENEIVRVRLTEHDKLDQVVIVPKKESTRTTAHRH